MRRTARNVSEANALRKRKEKSGTLQIVKNLELKNSKLSEQKSALKLQITTLTETVSELESTIIEKDAALKKSLNKERVTKISNEHLQKDLLAATINLKRIRDERSKLLKEVETLKGENDDKETDERSDESGTETVLTEKSLDEKIEENNSDTESSNVKDTPMRPLVSPIFDIDRSNVTGIDSLNEDSDEKQDDAN